MKIIKNVLPKPQADWLETTVLNYGKWNYLADSSKPGWVNNEDSELEHRKTYAHMSLPIFCVENPCPVQNREWLDKMDSTIHTFAHIANCLASNLSRLRFCLYLPSDPGEPHEPHMDSQIPHTVVLYYLNDSDGDTYFYKQVPYSIQQYDAQRDYGPVVKRISPKKNTAVIFDGNTYHASSNPSEGVRLSMTINYRT